MNKFTSKIKLAPASEEGYVFSKKEKRIIMGDNDKRIIATMIQKTSLNPNLKEFPELRITDEEHKEIVQKTIYKVVEKLDNQLNL